MFDFSNVLKTINMYYPKDVCYDKPEYKLSSEFLNNVRKREETKNNLLYATRLNTSIKRVFDKFVVVDWTDMESFNCYEYRVLLHQDQPILDDDAELMKVLGGKRIDLFLFISALNKYYYFFINETIFDQTSDEWKFKKIFDYPKKIEAELENLQAFFDSEEYFKISNDMAHKIVDGVETELIERGKVSIFNCLFTDIISI